MARIARLAALAAIGGIGIGAAQAQYCDEAPDQANIDALQALEESGVYQDDPEIPTVCIPVSFHVLTRTDGTGGPTQAQLDQAVASMNTFWSGSGVSFTQLRPTWTIPNTAWYDNPATYWQTIVKTGPVPGTVNVYIERPFGFCFGNASFTTTEINGVPISYVRITQDCLVYAGLSHEVGHYLNLYHTFTPDCPGNTTTCDSVGDLICDTDADFNAETNINPVTCMYTNPGTHTAPCGALWGNVPVRNIMSYHYDHCRTQVTAEQARRARNTVGLRADASLGNPPSVPLSSTPGWINRELCPLRCWANCDGSTASPALTGNDFICFQSAYAAAQALSYEQQIVHYANCDGSTVAPVINVNDFNCFLNRYAAGCP